MNRSFLFFLLCGLMPLLPAQEVDLSLFNNIQARNIGPAGMSGRVTAIDVVLQEPNTMYVGAAAGGVWRSENGGQSWTPIFEHERTASIGAIAIYQKNPNIIYVGTGEGNPRNSQNSGWGMYKTIDGGRSWQQLGLELTRQIHRVIVHPENPEVVWAGASGASWADSEHRGIYKSTDGGKSWRKQLYVNARTGCSDLVMDPSNPNKLIAGMWEHHRDAWYFQSGGAGSGIYLSYDGGESWKKLGPENGLPKGNLGRIGLSFAPSQPEVVYAYIESQDNGIFRSDDGGENWKRVSKPKDPQIGGRPFYYADIYVDTHNENRVYSIATEVTVSEDGGKSWSTFVPGNKVHTDHHAWWSHPHDPDFILLGHDGGLSITRDRGKKWDFVEHLPLGQFYHVRVDMEMPYNVYGGLQDNGSWVGPSQSWFKGGIRNMYWQRLSVGDGFDVVPDPLDSRYGYAMGQAGNLVRYHRPSGQLLSIKPVHPEGEYLRFNWNAGIAINPHNKKTVYYGSQYLHKSDDYGQSWQIISPDLTTNDPAKQKALESGGLTFDVTGAENHTTIIAIAPSPVDENVIWVGTDDGQLQLTRDGGKSWTNVGGKIKGVPENTWIPHIKASNFEAGEAFVVFDDHRRNNWTPYLYRTRNFGKSWERIVEEGQVETFVYCFEQDPVLPDLYFCGTDVGLYLSLDAGKHWQRWTHGLPTVPVSDLVVHPREHDLVIGTFGRSIWILDDIRPLREIAEQGAKKVLKEKLHLFPVPDAVLAVIGESFGYREGKVGDHLYQGENRPYGALITYSLQLEDAPTAKPLPLAEQVKIEVSSADGQIRRTLYQMPQNGITRVNWPLERDMPRMPMVPKPASERPPSGGLSVPPGTYTVTITYGGQQVSAPMQVLSDPRLNRSRADIAEKEALFQQFLGLLEQSTQIADQVRKMEQGLKFVKEQLKKQPNDSLKQQLQLAEKELDAIKQQLYGRQNVQGIYRDPFTVTAALFQTRFLLGHSLAPASPNQQTQLKLCTNKVDALRQAYKALREGAYEQLKNAVAKQNWNPLE